MKSIATLVISAALTMTAVAYANDAHHPEKARASASADLVSAEVMNIDKDGGKVTLRHGRIASLDLTERSTAFRVKDGAMLGQVKVGDNVRFLAERSDGDLVITRIESIK